MNNLKVSETYEYLTKEQEVVKQIASLTKRRLPSFPLKHVHSAFLNAQDARQAAFALMHAGFDTGCIQVLDGREYIEAVSQGQSIFGFLTSMNYDVYLREANRGCTFLVVRPTNYDQLRPIQKLLVLNHAHRATYVDRWATTELVS